MVDFPTGVTDTAPDVLLGGNSGTSQPAKTAITAKGRALIASADVEPLTAAQKTKLDNLGLMKGHGWREEFRGGATFSYGLASSTSGGSVNTTINPVSGDGGRDGIIQLRTGATAAADQRGAIASNLTQGYVGLGNSYYFGVGVRPQTNPDGTNTGRHIFGFADVISSIGGGAMGVRSVDGGNWTFFTRNATVETAFDTGLAPTINVWRDFVFIVDGAGTSMKCYVDGVLVTTLTTNINTTGNRFGIMASCHRVAATAVQLAIDLDYIDFQVLYGTPRGVPFMY